MLNPFEYYFRAFYEGGIFVYGLTILLMYATLAILSFIGIARFIKREKHIDYNKLNGSPFTPGISIIAPAFNEGVTIIQNVRSLMTLNYSRYEIIIINDGSTDDTLEKLIKEFELTEVDFAYNEKIKTQPVRHIFKSTNQAFEKLLVIDKVNGKSKADASNAGINAAAYDFYLCTDVDCILERDTLTRMIYPFLAEKEAGEKRVIATGATLRIANSSDIEDGMIVRMRPPKKLLPRFQEMEYIRSYVLGKMGWSMINCVPNVSGGLGMFDKEIAIKAGGYDPLSFGEDMDLIVRMCAYMRDNNQQYIIRYIPSTQCATEGPPNLKIFGRQRTRWGRGLIQIMSLHRKILLNPRYGRLGMVVFLYNFLFEFLAPIIEVIGILYYIYIVVTHQINLPYAILLLIFVYFYSVMITTMAVFWDQIVHRNYKTWAEVFGLSLMAFLEPLLYHPLIVFFALKGYYFFLTGQKHVWGNMQRQGFGQKKPDS
ncbi:MAG: glycosyltransferase [Bacteroidota bacterium]|nr:glycosyltransferase [Bacteroidota bacterium]